MSPTVDVEIVPRGDVDPGLLADLSRLSSDLIDAGLRTASSRARLPGSKVDLTGDLAHGTGVERDEEFIAELGEDAGCGDLEWLVVGLRSKMGIESCSRLQIGRSSSARPPATPSTPSACHQPRSRNARVVACWAAL
jgi:hypothetical protein